MPAFLLTTFLGSFLLFQVQPLIGRYILPWFGGGPAVWTTCMLFFQVMLLAGYGYAHLLSSANRRRQGFIHAALLVAALAFLPISPSPQIWKPTPETDPVTGILLLLLANIGAPYLILAATAPLLQHWFVRSFPERSPYRLYSLSNAASLLALLGYPFLVEPNFTLARQVTGWSWGFALFTVCCGWCALRSPAAATEVSSEPDAAAAEGSNDALRPGVIFLWLALSACGSALLLATTNQLCQEVAVVPFLWVVPLAMYLTTFTICFNSDRAYRRWLWLPLAVAVLIPVCRLIHVGPRAGLPFQLLGYLGTLFVFCMACHGELFRCRPASRHLTAYYLTLALGGALGGMAVAIGAPLLFRGFWELPIALLASCMALAWALLREPATFGVRFSRAAGSVAVTGAMGIFSLIHMQTAETQTLASSRNFYGVLKVIRTSDKLGEKLFLQHGRIMHGSQYCEPGLCNLATTYYGPESGVALALQHHPRRLSGEGLRVGVIGLGVGTVAVYGESGDTFRFYEINDEVTRFADRYFSYRRNSAARIETVAGDARITMEGELKRREPQRFDVLVVDAFSSDSIPAHLLTRECFQIYRNHLNPDGLLLVHVTNRFLNLVPVVQAQAWQLGLRSALVVSPGDRDRSVSQAKWMILTRNEDFLWQAGIKSRLSAGLEQPAVAPWTDDFVSLWQIVKW